MPFNSDPQRHEIFHGLLRNGDRVRYRKMTEEERKGGAEKFMYIGWYPEPTMFFRHGDPEMWTESLRWSLDGKDSRFDIVRELGIEQPPEPQWT